MKSRSKTKGRESRITRSTRSKNRWRKRVNRRKSRTRVRMGREHKRICRKKEARKS